MSLKTLFLGKINKSKSVCTLLITIYTVWVYLDLLHKHTHHSLKYSIHWDDYYIVGGTGNTILHDTPKPPRLLDPANPANNLFDTGFTTTRTGDRSHDEGEGNWAEIKKKIETIDLTVDITA